MCWFVEVKRLVKIIHRSLHPGRVHPVLHLRHQRVQKNPPKLLSLNRKRRKSQGTVCLCERKLSERNKKEHFDTIDIHPFRMQLEQPQAESTPQCLFRFPPCTVLAIGFRIVPTIFRYVQSFTYILVACVLFKYNGKIFCLELIVIQRKCACVCCCFSVHLSTARLVPQWYHQLRAVSAGIACMNTSSRVES